MRIEDAIQSIQQLGGMIPTLGISFDIGPEEVRCRMTIGQAHMGAPGVAHGGALMTFLDTALGVCALMHAMSKKKATSTVELKVNFLRPARMGQALVTKTTIQSAGRSLLVLSGSAIDEATGEPVAFAVGTYNLYDYGKGRRADPSEDEEAQPGGV